eukprot:PhF_6_TR25341/c3_g1_i1/m.35040
MKGGATVTKIILVTVLWANYACFGVGSTDGNVCSGHGKCGSDGLCICSSSLYTGSNCNLTSSCPFDTTFDFESDDGHGLMRIWDADVVFSTPAAFGSGSFEVYADAYFYYSRGIQQLEWYTNISSTLIASLSQQRIVLSGWDTAVNSVGWIECVTLTPISSGRWNLTVPITSSSKSSMNTTTGLMA